MQKHLIAYAGAAITMIAIDLVWLGVIAKPLYQQGLGHLLADEPRIGVAVWFYAAYPIGLVLFAIAPQEAAKSWTKTAGWAALFGAFAYGTYDLTNLATLTDWPMGLALIDMAWGTAVSAVAACGGKAAMDRFAVR